MNEQIEDEREDNGPELVAVLLLGVVAGCIFLVVFSIIWFTGA